MVAARVLVGIQLERSPKTRPFQWSFPGRNGWPFRHLKKWLAKKRGLGCFHLLGFFSMIWMGLQQNHDLSGAAGHGPTHHSKPWKEPFLGWQGLGLQGSQGMINTAKTWEDDSHEKINCFKTLRALFRGEIGERFVHREKWLEMLQKLFRTWVSSDSDWWKLMESTKMGTKKWATVDGCKNLRFPVRAWDEHSKCLPTAW